MDVSREDALAFLRRLSINNESSVVASFRTNCGLLCMICHVSGISPDDDLILEQYSATEPFTGEAVRSFVPLDDVVLFRYGDIREAAPDHRPELESHHGPILGALTMYFSEFEALVLVEHERTRKP